jgi:hypothetical protein
MTAAALGGLRSIGKGIDKRDVARTDTRRLQHPKHALLAARGECLGLGAEFHLIGDDDRS